MHFDLHELVRESLRSNGCDESLLNDFDGHSTISLDFRDAPSILIAEYEGSVIIWSRIAEFNQHTLEQSAASILNIIMEGAAFSVSGQCHLDESEGYLIIKSILKTTALNKDDFSAALEDFYMIIGKFIGALK